MSIPDDGFRRAQQMYDNQTDDFLHPEPETAEDRGRREAREQEHCPACGGLSAAGRCVAQCHTTLTTEEPI